MSNSNQNRRALLILIALIVLALIAVLLLFVVLLNDSGGSDDGDEVVGQPTAFVEPTQPSAPNPTEPGGSNSRPTVIPGADAPTADPAEAVIGDDSPDIEATFNAEVDEAVNPAATQPPVVIPTATSDGEGGAPIAAARTLVVGDGAETLEPNGVFDFIRYVQDSTNEDMSSFTEIYPDGRVVRDEFEGQISPEEVQHINDLITQLNFFGMQGNLISNTRTEGETLYRLTIIRSGLERAVFGQDGFMPAQLIELMAAIRSVGDQVAMEALGF